MYEYRVYEDIAVLPIKTKISFLTNKKIVLNTKNPSDLYDFFRQNDIKYKKYIKFGGKNTREYKEQYGVQEFIDDTTKIQLPLYKTIKEFVAVKYNTKTKKYSYWFSC